MVIFNCSIFILIFLFTIYRVGILLNFWLQNDKKMLHFLSGFLTLVGIWQLILTPCIVFHTSFLVAFYLAIILTLILVIASFFVKRKNTKKKIENKGLTILVGILVGIQIIASTYFYQSNADDSFYVSLSTASIDTQSLYQEEPSMGYKSKNGKTLLSVTEQIPTIELQIAIYSKLAGVNPAIMCHFILPIILIAIAYLAFYEFAKSLTKEKNAKLFLSILAIIFMFAAFSTKFRTGCLLVKPWQGKAMFLNIALPVILSCLIKMDQKVEKKDVLLLGMANLFSIAVSSTAIFLVPFTYLAFGFLKLIQRKGKDIRMAYFIFYTNSYLCFTLYWYEPKRRRSICGTKRRSKHGSIFEIL